MKMLFEQLSYVNKFWAQVHNLVDRHVPEACQLPEILLHQVDHKIADDLDAHTGMGALPILQMHVAQL